MTAELWMLAAITAWGLFILTAALVDEPLDLSPVARATTVVGGRAADATVTAAVWVVVALAWLTRPAPAPRPPGRHRRTGGKHGGHGA